MTEQKLALGRDWRSRAILLKERSSVANADVYLLEVAGRVLLAKTYADNPAWARWFFGRVALAREHYALACLHEMQWVPQTYGLVNGDTLLIEYVAQGDTLGSSKSTPRESWPPPLFFQRLRQLVDTLHRHGVAHGDIRRRNILRDKDEQPFLIDFATAVRWKKNNLFARCLFRAVRRADDFSLAKLRASFYPDSLSSEETQRILAKPWYLRLGHFFRKQVYRKWIKHPRRQRRETAAKSNS